MFNLAGVEGCDMVINDCYDDRSIPDDMPSVILEAVILEMIEAII